MNIVRWDRIRAVVVEDEPLASEYLSILLDQTCKVEVVGTASNGEAALALCAEKRPDAAFLDVRLPGGDGLSLAERLAMLPQPPHLVFTTGDPDRATDAFRLEAVDYLLKPLAPGQVDEAIERLWARLRPFTSDEPIVDRNQDGLAQGELLPVRDIDRDQIRLLARREIVAALRQDRRTWIHTVREEFPTYYPLSELAEWLGGNPFIQLGRHAIVNVRAIDHLTHFGDRLYRARLRDRVGTELRASRTGAGRLAAFLKSIG